MAAAVLVFILMGYCSYIITGGSMTGAISKGSLAIERRVPVDSLQVGDIITFHPPDSDENVTHRVISIQVGQDGQKVFRTQGDANPSPDPWEMTLNGPRQAKFVFSIPWMGYALALFTLRWVRTGMLALAALALLLGVVLHLRQDSADDCETESVTDGDAAGDCR
jgi:signal peptidase